MYMFFLYMTHFLNMEGMINFLPGYSLYANTIFF